MLNTHDHQSWETEAFTETQGLQRSTGDSMYNRTSKPNRMFDERNEPLSLAPIQEYQVQEPF